MSHFSTRRPGFRKSRNRTLSHAMSQSYTNLFINFVKQSFGMQKTMIVTKHPILYDERDTTAEWKMCTRVLKCHHIIWKKQ